MFRTFADFFRILTSGAFRHADYAWLHLGSRYLAPLALLHYMAAGEKRGLRPAPFFDPAFFARNTPQPRSGNLFAAFLRDLRGAPACAEYDEAWFLAQNPEAAFAASPWDYLRLKGIHALRDPSPAISLAFVADAYRGRNKRLARTLMKIFERRRGDGKISCVLNLADLKANQAAFREKIVLQTLASETPKRSCLVFIQTSGGHDPTLHDPARCYDLMLNYYQPPKQPPLPAEHVFAQNGTKTTGIAKLLEARPDLLASYDYILFLDDDIGVTPEQIAEFFAVMKAQQLDFAQPALTDESFGSFPALYQKANSPGFRRVNYVEIMMPALSRRGLQASADCFSQGISGFAVDALIGARIMACFGPQIAVVDRVAARHTRPIDLDGGPLYRYLSANGIDPGVEMWTILAENHLEHGLREWNADGR